MADQRIAWLRELADAVPTLPQESAPRPYWSQRQGVSVPPSKAPLPTVVRRVKREIESLAVQHWFARTLGYECVDGHGESDTTIEEELDRRVGKPGLPITDEADWTEDDLCDFIEVYHDLAARPSRGWVHSFGGCGFHPTRFARSSGQRVYRWRINAVLTTSSLDLQLADEGEDAGRMTRVLPDGLGELTRKLATVAAETEPEIPHAIALFRRHNASREDRRMAVVGLARALEARRQQLKEHLLSKDESALFQIANQFDLRHRKADQMADYGDEYLDWLFHWYLATIDLIDRIRAKGA
ncbi:MAG TPA: hypothetical protein VNQ73_01380 [Ilumatobacter sp.]|nr:hypothetical protein [Ilumatobacter sp.]